MGETKAPEVPIYPNLAGRVAVVTGGSKGIGVATPRHSWRNGVSVAVMARDQADIERVVRQVRDLGARAVGISADAESSDDTERMRRQVEEEFGPVDILLPFASGFEA